MPQNSHKLELLLGPSKLKFVDGESIRALDADDDGTYSEFFVENSDPNEPSWSEDVEPTFIEADPNNLRREDVIRRISGGEIFERFKDFQSALTKGLTKP